MMSTKINISQVESLDQVLQILNNQSFGIGTLNAVYVMRHYPFEQLVQIHGLSHDIIRSNAQIIDHFLALEDFLGEEVYLKQTINFVISNLNFLLKQVNSQDTALMLLELLRKFFIRLNTLSKFIVHVDTVSELANCIIQKPHIENTKIKECVCNLLIEVLRCKNYQSNDRVVFVQCVTNLLSYIGSDLILGFKIIIEMHENRHFIDCLKIDSIYVFMECSIKDINVHTDDSTLHSFLKCVYLVWSSCSKLSYIKIFFSNILNKLELIQTAMRKTDDIRKYAIEIMILVVNHEFKHIAVNSTTLRNELTFLAKFEDWYVADCDVVYMMYYLEFIYLSVYHDQSIMLPKLLKAIVRDFPTNPAFNKSICFLFAVYAARHITREVQMEGEKILKYLDQEHLLHDVLTFHTSQLLWILTRGQSTLKIKVLKLWLKLYNNTNDIFVCVKASKTLPLIVDILKNPQDTLFHSRISDMLQHSDDPDLKRLRLISIMKPIPNFDFVNCLIKLNYLTGNEVELGVFLSKQILITMLKIQNTNMMDYACSYSLEIILKFQDHSVVVSHYMEDRMIQMFLQIAKTDDEHLAVLGLTLIRVIMELQNKKKLKSRTTHADFSELLRGTGTRLSNALTLLNTVIKLQHEEPILSFRKPSFRLWHRLVFLKDTNCRKQVFKVLGKIMREEKYLACTIPNTLLIMSECNRKDFDTNGFPIFLYIWLLIVKDNNFYNVPCDDIKRYLGKLDDSQKVQAITNLLNKCPSTTTTTNFFLKGASIYNQTFINM